MQEITNYEHNHQYIRVLEPPAVGAEQDWLNPQFWQQREAVVGQSKGRNTVWFVTDGQREFVLRHYYRGGLPGKFIRDQFLYTGMENTRSIAEFNLLGSMHALGLPVPKPVAAKVYQIGLWYRADILIERIANSQDLFSALSRAPVAEPVWHAIGTTIAAFQLAGVQHSDLNCHNILLQHATVKGATATVQSEQETKIWLIDFDRCDMRPPGAWQERNLKRLKRSLRKEQAQQRDFFWQEQDWQALLRGYNEHVRNHQG